MSRFYVGLDLGQRRDHSVVAEKGELKTLNRWLYEIPAGLAPCSRPQVTFDANVCSERWAGRLNGFWESSGLLTDTNGITRRSPGCGNLRSSSNREATGVGATLRDGY